MVFNKEMATATIKSFRELGFEVMEGLSGAKLEAVEAALGTSIPADLKCLLTEGVPLADENDSFPNWHLNPEQIVAESRESIEHTFIFDIEENGYWHESFGLKPTSIEVAKEQALGVIRSWPPLIKVYGHRYMPTVPAESGNPIISIWQPTDAVYYGNDLVDYLQNEFNIILPIEHAKEPREVPYWGPALGL